MTFKKYYHQPHSFNQKDQAYLDSIVAEINKPAKIKAEVSYAPTIFDPNELDAGQWIALGIPPDISSRIIKYRQKVGNFSKKEDLLKIYGFKKEDYERLEPYIIIKNSQFTTSNINDRNDKEPKPKLKPTAMPIQKFDLNKADTLDLMNIKGIGPVLSKRIIAYREKLGGFISPEQLREVYKLEDDAVNRLQENSFIDSLYQIKQINLNTCGFKELSSHPYIPYKTAKIIINYRDQHGPFSSIQDLRQIKIIDQEFVDKIRPYVTY
ncbi:MAG: ComEA family DNA-binding protein [Cytophagaceae bacterium]